MDCRQLRTETSSLSIVNEVIQNLIDIPRKNFWVLNNNSHLCSHHLAPVILKSNDGQLSRDIIAIATWFPFS